MLKINILQQLLEQRNLSSKTFCKQVGITTSSLKRILRNNSTRIQTLERFAETLNVPISIFFTTGKKSTETKKPHIPVTAQAGTLGSYSDPYRCDECDLYHTIPGFSSYDFTITISGNSMLPLYQDGDVVACRFIHNLGEIENDKNYVIDCSEGIVIKQIHTSRELAENECIQCISLNPAYKPFTVSINELYTIARVVGSIKNC